MAIHTLHARPLVAGFVILGLVTLGLAAGCQSGKPAGDQPLAVYPTAPLTQDNVVITANGLSCPLCAHNIDSTLKKLPGVQSVEIDLNTGRINVGLFGKSKPSKASLATAVTNAGFTVLSID